MKKLLSNLKLSKGEIFIVAVFILAFFFLRLYDLERRTSFGFDQAEIAFKAVEILRGEPVVLGQATSVGKFAIGPYFTYLWAASDVIFDSDPIAGVYASIFLGLLTTVAFYFFGKTVFDKKTGLFLAGVYALSHAAIIFDLSPWGVSMFYLAQTLILLGALLATKKPFGLSVFALGFLIGFSSHLAVVLSLVPVFFFWLVYRPKITKAKDLVLPGTIAFFGILPNLLFDVTHHFENFKRLFDISANTGFVGGSAHIYKVFYSVYSNAIGFLIPDLVQTTQLLLFSGVIVLSLVSVSKSVNLKTVTLLLLSIVVPMLVFIFWRGNFSEYYVIMTTTPFIFLVGYVVYCYFRKYPYMVLTIAGIALFANLTAWRARVRPLNLLGMKQAVSTIVEMGGKEGYGVSFTTEPGYQFGYDYLFYYYGAKPDTPPKKDQKKIFTIVIPPGFEGVNAKLEFEGIGLLWEGVDED